MAVQPRQASWTDERLDDLNLSIRDGFARNDREHEAFRDEMRAMRGEMREMRTEMTSRIDGLQRTMVVGLFGLSGSIVAALIAVLVKLG